MPRLLPTRMLNLALVAISLAGLALLLFYVTRLLAEIAAATP